eukprot:g38529.t1
MDSTDDVTSADAGHATSGTAAAIHTADTAASFAETGSTTDIKDAPADTDAALPTTPPTAPTASSSTVNTSPQPCWVFTIPPPDLPLTEDE